MITPEVTNMIKMINDKVEKKQIARDILERLPEWFGIPEARENYIEGSAGQIFLAARNNNETVGFLCLEMTGQTDSIFIVALKSLRYSRIASIAVWNAFFKGFSFSFFRYFSAGGAN